jgi:hypothetical protein
MLPAETAVLLHLEPFRRLLLVLRGAVVAAFALTTGHLNDVSHYLNPSGQQAIRRSGHQVQANSEFLLA